MKMWLVGAGYWGSKLVENLKKFDIAATVVDIRNGQTINYINTLDPVMIATPLWQHYDQTCELLKRGHDVYVEKPMAETTQQIETIATLAKPEQLVMVGHLFVYHPQMQLIQKYINDGIIGNITHITSRRLNWGIYQTETDPLLSLATHDISIVETMAEAQLTPIAATAWNYSENTQPDRVWFSGQAGDHITFDIDVSWHWPVRIRQTVIIGTKAQIVWDQDANTVMIFQNRIQNHRAVVDTAPVMLTYDFDRSPIEQELAHWINCIERRIMPRTSVSQAKSVAITIERVKSLL